MAGALATLASIVLVSQGFGQDRSPASPILFKPLQQISVDTHQNKPVPDDLSHDVFREATSVAGARPVGETRVQWVPANLHHETLYFDELMLERHGVTVAPRLQPIFSGAHFFGVAASMPYRLVIDRPHDIHYAFGHGRPGDPAPCVRQGLPWDPDATLVQSAAVAALVLIVP